MSSFGDASKQWRERLMSEVKCPILAQSFDLKKYYEFARKVLEMAQAADAGDQYSTAYIKYKLYLSYHKEIIVKHNYYAHYKAEREAHNRQFALAVEQCTALVKRMDVEASQHTEKVQAEQAARAAAQVKEQAERAERVRLEQERQARATAAMQEAAAEAERVAAQRAAQEQEEQRQREAAARARAADAETALRAAAEASAAAAAATAAASVPPFEAVGGCTWQAGQEALYAHSDGRQEQVSVVRAHSLSEGGGYTIWVPSLGRERQTLAERLRPLGELLPSPPQQQPPSSSAWPEEPSNDPNDLLGLGASDGPSSAAAGSTSRCPPGSGAMDTGTLADALACLDYDPQHSSGFKAPTPTPSARAPTASAATGSNGYGTVPVPSWMPSSNGDAHRVDIRSSHPPQPAAVPSAPPPEYDEFEKDGGDEEVWEFESKVEQSQAQAQAAAAAAAAAQQKRDNEERARAAVSARAQAAALAEAQAREEWAKAQAEAEEVAAARQATEQAARARAQAEATARAEAEARWRAEEDAYARAVAASKAINARYDDDDDDDDEGEELSFADELAQAAAAAGRTMAVEPSSPPIATTDAHGPQNGQGSAATTATTTGNRAGYGAFSRQLSGVYSCRQLARECEALWGRVVRSGRARITSLNTFQGRLATDRYGSNGNGYGNGYGSNYRNGQSNGGGDSTNGCTVIAPLIGYRHIKWPEPFLPNTHVEHVIDADCPPILNQIRAKYSLPAGAFVVPADVHDFLFDKKLLEEALFGGVHGGSVLDDDHMGALVECLEQLPGKGAVCFFFHEHVTAILKLANGRGYELVDSLPHAPSGMGVRIACDDAASLRACLAWYCTSKFSPSNMDYVDSHPWDESAAESDPRLFQGHVWAEPA